MHTTHWRDEDLIELALDERVHAAELALCPHCSARLREWRDFLEDLRQRAEQGARAEETDAASLCSLAERVLAETTRFDPSRREDRRFLDRLQRSRGSRPWKRVAAAAGMLAGLWLLGALVWRFDSASRGALATAHEADLADHAPQAATARPVPEEPGERADGGLDALDTRLASAAPETAVGRILGSRGAWLRQREPIETRAIAGASSDPTARALLCEHVLDRYAVEDYIPENFGDGIQAMLSASTPDTADRRLELAAVARARDYGLLDSAEEGHLGEALAKAGVDPSVDPLFQDGARTRAPIDSAWLGALEDTLEGAERCDPVVQAWLALR